MEKQNKVAILTGSSRGIGKAIAIDLAKEGIKVVVSSRKQAAVDEVANEIINSGGEALAVECHVGKSEQLKNLYDKTIDKYGRVDVLINNAATNPVFDSLNKLDKAKKFLALHAI